MKSFENFMSEAKGDDKEYEAIVRKLLKKYGVEDIKDIPKDKKDDFFNELDKAHKSDKEEKGIDEAELTEASNKKALRELEMLKKQLEKAYGSNPAAAHFSIEDAILQAIAAVDKQIENAV